MQRLLSPGERSSEPVRPRRAMPVLPADVRNLPVPAALIQESTGLTMTDASAVSQALTRSTQTPVPRGAGVPPPLDPVRCEMLDPTQVPSPKKSSGTLS